MSTTKLKVDEELASKYTQLTPQQHAQQKSMYLGSHKVASYPIYTVVGDGSIKLETLRFSQVFYKMVDEIIVNVIDVFMRYGKVKKITITFDPKTCTITIHNDGPGMPAGVVQTANNKAIYLPQLLCTEFLSGSNHDDCKDRSIMDNISAGVNGLGLKLVMVNSKTANIETYDFVRKIYYTQQFDNRLDDIHEPIVKKLSAADIRASPGGVKITFTAAWEAFTGWRSMATIFNVMDPIFQARIMFASAYLNTPISYNSEVINIKGATGLSKLLISDSTTISVVIKPETSDPILKKYKWDTCFAIAVGDPVLFSVVNGAPVTGGQHLTHLSNAVVTALKPKIERMLKKAKSVKYTKRMITSHLSVVMVGSIPNIEFDSQLKTKLVCSDEVVAAYKIPPVKLKLMWEQLEPILFDQYMVTEKKKTTRRKAIPRNKDYKPAEWVGAKNKVKYLFYTEGQSASTMIRTCLENATISDWSFKNCGILCGGGVGVNARQHVTVTTKGGKRRVTLDTTILKSPKFALFLQVNNLDPACAYQSKSERDTLAYNHIIITTDADVDGHNICGINISNFIKLWPGLIEHGVIMKLSTPIQRWYPTSLNGKVENFYSERQARDWLSAHPNSKGIMKYFKGLATHENEDAFDIFGGITQLLTTFYLTDNSDSIADHMFDKDTAMRKMYHSEAATMTDDAMNTLYTSLASNDKTPLECALEKHVCEENEYKTGISMRMRSEQFMLTCGIEYQVANNDRSLPHIMDGLLRTHRKCICAGLLNGGIGEKKVFQWGGHVAMTMAYHHGSASVEGCIIGLAQDFIGANNVPVFLPIGQYGSRSCGGDDAGSSRYIVTNINPITKKLFREEDTYILNYTAEDGEIVEPDYYVPVYPHALNCNHDNIGHAWRTKTFARSHNFVMINIHRMLGGEDPIPMPHGFNGWTGRVVSIDGVEYSFGDYTYDVKKNVINITELPFQVWTDAYLWGEKSGISVTRADIVENITTNATDGGGVNIYIHLKPGAMELIEDGWGGKQFDPIIECFKLKSSLRHHMHFLSGGVSTLHFSKYTQLLKPWFNERKRLYDVRLTREAIIIKLQIEYYDNLIRFILGYEEFHIDTGTTTEDADAQLTKNKFAKFNITLMNNPKFTPLDKIVTTVKSGTGSTFDYIKSAHNPNKRTPAQQKINATKKNDLLVALKKCTASNAVEQTWLRELDEYAAAITTAASSGWRPKRVRYKQA